MRVRAVKGTRDILPSEIERWRIVEECAREIFGRYGFREIRTPVFEHSVVFEKGTGESSDIVQKEMYRFKDLSDNDLTLRPEATPAMVRAYIEHGMGEGGAVEHLYCIGPMFRYERPQKGRYRQFHQVNAEVFGADNPVVDAEVIEMGMRWLQSLGIESPELGINSVGDEICRPRYREALVCAQRERLDELCADCRRRHKINPLRVFDCKTSTCQPIIAALPRINDHLCEGCSNHFRTVQSSLATWNVQARIDPTLVRGLDYYRRTVFEVTSSMLGAQDALLGGGRYDGLVARLGGEDVPGVGFAAGIERIVIAMPDIPFGPAVDLFLVTLEESAFNMALELIVDLRSTGLRCQLDYHGRSLRAQLRTANRMAVPVTTVLGGDEVATGRFVLRRMSDGHQVEVAAAGMAKGVRDLLGGSASSGGA